MTHPTLGVRRSHRSRCDYIMHRDRRLFQKVSIKHPEQFETDHLMLVSRYLVKPTRYHKAYLLGRKKFPLKPPTVDLTQADHLWNTVKAQMPKQEQQQQRAPRPTWIAPATLRLMDQRCALRK